MGVKILRLSELSGLDGDALESRVADFNSGYDEPVNGEIEDLNRRISVFETRYEMSTDTMLERFQMCAQDETNDMCQWVQLHKIRSGLVQRTR